MTGQCKCQTCVEGREFTRIIAQLPQSDKEWMENFRETQLNEQLDANVNECIINGTWPNSDEIIKSQRDKLIIKTEVTL